MIRGIIFDMDGVLIDAKEWHYEALNMALHKFGYEISRNDHLEMYDGLPTGKKLKMLSQYEGLPIKLHSLVSALKQKYTIEYILKLCAPNFQHRYAISKLKSQGYKLALASNSIRETINLMLGSAQIKDYFDVIMSAEDVSYGKPDPEIYTKTMHMLGLDPTECLILEDNFNGIKAAIDSGAFVLKIRNVDDVNHNIIMKKINELDNGI